MEGEIETADLVEIVKTIDPKMTATKLRRWRRAGLLIDAPRRIGLGRGLGSRSYYPASAIEPAQTIAVLLKQRRDRKWVGWKLWLMDFGVADRYWRPRLREDAALWDGLVPAFRDLLDSEDDEALESVIKDLQRERIDNSLVSAIRKSLGPKRFAAIAATFFEMGAGYYEGPANADRESEEYRDAADLMDLALGLRRARTDHVGDRLTLLRNDVQSPVGDYLPVLKDLAVKFTEVCWSDILAEISDDELNEAKRELVNLFGHLAIADAGFSYAFGPDAFGLRRAASMRDLLSSGNLAILVVGWAIYRRKTPAASEGAQAIKAALEASGMPVISNMERVNIHALDRIAPAPKLRRTKRVFPHQEWLDYKRKL